MKRFLMSAPIALAATPLLAGSLADPVVEPAPEAPAYVAPVGEWTGFYLGGQAGYGSADVPGADYDGGLAGLHAGYMHDIGNWVIGGELDYDWAQMENGGAEIDSIARAKLIGGYDFGDTLLYATVGGFNANLAAAGGDTDDSGALVGAGLKYRIADGWLAGVEALYHQADDFGGVAGNDLDATTVTARISYQF